jgi:hypothetical protein
MAIIITRKQRRRIREVVLSDLSGLGDIEIAMRHEDWESAKRLRRTFETSMRLLDDLGWEEAPPTVIELTMPEPDLVPALIRLHARVVAGVADPVMVAHDDFIRDSKDAAALAAVLDQINRESAQQ